MWVVLFSQVTPFEESVSTSLYMGSVFFPSSSRQRLEVSKYKTKQNKCHSLRIRLNQSFAYIFFQHTVVMDKRDNVTFPTEGYFLKLSQVCAMLIFFL